LKNPFAVAIAVVAFVAIFLVKVPFPVIIVGAAIAGVVAGRLRPDLVASARAEEDDQSDVLLADHHEVRGAATRGRNLGVLLLGLAVWWVPIAIVILVRGSDDALSREGVFFSQAAMVTFGGAYSVLAYINQAAVQHFGWLDPGQMVTGLGLAESTPGPLIMVTEFVGFLGAYRFPGGLDPVVAGILGAGVAVWATFAPCFLWIFLGAPYIERLRGNRTLDAALSSVTAAVVGVILNLA
jgi:chromate transporter